jgi:hypothetical protein
MAMITARMPRRITAIFMVTGFILVELFSLTKIGYWK